MRNSILNILTKNSILSLGIIILLTWSTLITLRTLHILENVSAICILIQIFLVDIFNIILIHKIYFNTQIENKKSIKWLVLSIYAFFIVDILYFIIYSIPKISQFELLFNIMHFCYYISTITFIISILAKSKIKNKLFMLVLITIVAISLVIFAVFSIDTHYLFGEFPLRIKIDIVQSIIDLTLFSLAFLWLVYSHGNSTALIASGYILCSASEFMMTSCYMTNILYLLDWAQLAWFLGVILIMFGMITIINNKEYNVKDWVLTTTMIKTRLILSSFSIVVLSLIIFFIVLKEFAIINNKFYIFFPTIVMDFTLIIALFSILISKTIGKPLLQIQNDIENSLLNNKLNLIENNLTLGDAFRYGEIQKIEAQIKAAISFVNKQSNDAAFGKIAKKVAHNIKSPINTLQNCKIELSKIKGIDQKFTSDLGIAIENIKYTLINLLHINEENKFLTQEDSAEPRHVLLKPLINEVINQKLIEWHNKCGLLYEDNISNNNIWLVTIPYEFRNNISNLLNNSFESFKAGIQGIIKVSLDVKNDIVTLNITDNGSGIEKDILPKIEKGFSTKVGGQGIGLPSAIEYFNNLNGYLTIPFTGPTGTSIDIYLPNTKLPSWLPNGIKLTNYIVILDDAITTHTYLQTAFSRIKNVKYFTKIEEFKHWINAHQQIIDNTTFFIDNQLDDDFEKGIDLIETYKLMNTAYLLTNEFNNQIIQSRAIQHNIKIIPKPLIQDFIVNEY